MLGPDWGTHVDGQELKADGEAFKQKLSPLTTFEDWKKKVLWLTCGLAHDCHVLLIICRWMPSLMEYRGTYSVLALPGLDLCFR